MLPEDMPRCECGKRNYSSGGGMVSHDIVSQQFNCSSCNRMSLYVYLFGYSAILYMKEPPREHHRRDASANKVFDYVNEHLVSFARWNAAKSARPELLPTPPSLPKEVVCKLIRPNGLWCAVDHEESAKVPPFVDPIRARHDERWAALHEKLGFQDAQPTMNRYFPDFKNLEPWFTKSIEGADLLYGPRKRVDSIEVTPKKAVNISRIAELAEKDRTTFYTEGQTLGEKEGELFATKFVIHAWSDEKVIEYMNLIVDITKPA